MPDFVSLNRSLTAQCLGRMRLIIAAPDWSFVEHLIATASPESHAEIARTDPDGLGYTVETVAYDLSLAVARTIARARKAPGCARVAVQGTLSLTVGDMLLTFRARQEQKRGDLVARMVGATEHQVYPLSDLSVRMMRAGKPVLVMSGHGLVNVTEMSRIPALTEL